MTTFTSGPPATVTNVGHGRRGAIAIASPPSGVMRISSAFAPDPPGGEAVAELVQQDDREQRRHRLHAVCRPESPNPSPSSRIIPQMMMSGACVRTRIPNAVNSGTDPVQHPVQRVARRPALSR